MTATVASRLTESFLDSLIGEMESAEALALLDWLERNLRPRFAPEPPPEIDETVG